jgi:predicted DNA-binding transcriptional regulator AlpA
VPERTIERWRKTGTGPRFVKLGRRVAYRACDLEAFVAAQVRTHTGERPVARRKRAGGK